MVCSMVGIFFLWIDTHLAPKLSILNYVISSLNRFRLALKIAETNYYQTIYLAQLDDAPNCGSLDKSAL